MSDINITVNDEIVNIDVIDTPVYVEVTNSPGPAGPAGVGVPIGGTTGQVLAKTSPTNYATAWVNPSGGTWGSITGTLSNQTDLQNALNAKFDDPTGTTAQYLRGDGSLATFPSLTGYVPYTGATTNVNLGEYELKAGQLTLDTSPTGTAAVGTIRWNDTTGVSETTLKGGSVLLRNGVDLVARVVNKVTPNTTLTKAAYQAVRVSGAQGQRLAVSLAQANNDANSADTIGLVTETIATNQEGFIMAVGQLENINTTGSLQGETWNDGDVLYLSPTIAGAITNVKPTGNGHIVVIGYVEYAHANNGKIYVKVMNGWELDELHDVSIVTPANNEALIYESSSALWKNKTIATALGFTPVPTTRTITINGVTFDLSADRSYTVSAGISGSGAAGQVAYWNGTTSQTGSSTFAFTPTSQLLVNNSVTAATAIARGINLTPTLVASANSDVLVGLDLNPTFTSGAFIAVRNFGLRISGNVNAALSNNIFNPSTGNRSQVGYSIGNSDSENFYGGFYWFAPTFSGVNVEQPASFMVDSSGSNGLNLLAHHASGTIKFITGAYNLSNERARFHATGNFSLGSTSDNGQRLQVYGDTLLRGSGNTNTTTALTVQNSSSTNLFVVRNDGNVGIGTNAPAYKLDIRANSNGVEGFLISNSNTGNAAATTFQFGQSPALSPYNAMYITNYGSGWTGGGGSANSNRLTSGSGSIGGFDIAIDGLNAPFRVFTNNGLATQKLQLFTSGNLVLQNGGTFSDNGQRLQVYGDTLLRGSGNTNTTTALTVQNSSSTNLFTVRNDGAMTIAGQVTTTNTFPTYRAFSSSATDTCGYQCFTNNGTGNNASFVMYGTGVGFGLGGNAAFGTNTSVVIFGSNSVTSGGTTNIRLRPGGYDTTADALVAYQNSVSIGTTNNPVASAVLDVVSTTKGFLPPRMTTTQKNAIATPAAGLVVYDTTLNKLCVYTTAWETITSI